jgi:hypothetical protein
MWRAELCYRNRRKKDTTNNSEDTDIVVDAVLLVLCYALGDPCDVADFLQLESESTALKQKCCKNSPAPSA